MSQLYVQTDGTRSYAQVHDQVAAGLSQMMGAAAPDAAGLQASHGPIATAVSTALSSVLETRHGTLQNTATSGTTISELLQKAAQMYEQGDRQGAEKLKAAADALQAHEGEQGGAPGGASSGDASGGALGRGFPGGAAGATGAGSPGVGTPAPGSAAVGMIGQILGQVGQQVGQIAGMVAQPLQGFAQGLQQVPQQVMQAVQGATGADKATLTGEEKSDRTKDPADRIRERSEPNPPHRTEPAPTGDDPPAGAAPGESTSGGRAPEHPVADRPQPAQTRPQAD
jgi:Excreted virulence factor EspC, type VII ESX diderm